jgi:hypothetical protein
MTVIVIVVVVASYISQYKHHHYLLSLFGGKFNFLVRYWLKLMLGCHNATSKNTYILTFIHPEQGKKRQLLFPPSARTAKASSVGSIDPSGKIEA